MEQCYTKHWLATVVLIYLLVGTFLLKPYLGIPYFLLCGPTLNALCLVYLLLYVQQSPWWSRLFNTKLFLFIGNISFSLFVWQLFFPMGPAKAVFQQYPLNLICVLCAGILSYCLVERPVATWRFTRSHNNGSMVNRQSFALGGFKQGKPS